MSCISELKVRQPKQQHNYTRALIKNASHLKHISAESEHSIEKQDLQQRCKKRAREEPEEKASNIIINVLKKDPLDIKPNEFESIRQSLYQERRKQYPKCPTSIEDTRTALESGTFNAPAEMVFAFRNDVIMVTFQNNFSLLNDRSLFGDGTFQSSPQCFYQLYTLHTEKLGHYIHLVFFLLPNKKEQTYLTMLELLLDECRKREIDFSPKAINVDFEIATHNAFRHFFPDIEIRGCNFHLKQAWLRKAIELGLKKDYEDKDSDVHFWLRILFGLPFLRPDQVPGFFMIDIASVSPLDSRTELFEQYLLKDYIEGKDFPPSLWASDEIDRPRTTYCCESFHKYFQDIMNGRNPNIFNFLHKLDSLQVLTQMKLNAIEQGKPAKKRQKKKPQERITLGQGLQTVQRRQNHQV